MSGLEDARYLLAATLSAGLGGLTVYAYQPPQPVPPCAVVLAGGDYLPPTGPAVTACSFQVNVTVRLIAATHDPEGALSELDGYLDRALTALAPVARWSRVDTGTARDIAGTTWLTADIAVTYPAERAAPARRP